MAVQVAQRQGRGSANVTHWSRAGTVKVTAKLCDLCVFKISICEVVTFSSATFVCSGFCLCFPWAVLGVLLNASVVKKKKKKVLIKFGGAGMVDIELVSQNALLHKELDRQQYHLFIQLFEWLLGARKSTMFQG